MSSVYVFVELSEKMENSILLNRVWMMKLYFLTSLSLWVQSCPLPPAIPSCIPLPYITSTPTTPITCSSFSFSSLGSNGNGNLTSPITTPPDLCVFLYIASYGGSRCLLHACVECWLMGAHDIGGREKAVIPGRMTFYRTGLCLDPCERSNTEAKQKASSCSVKPHGKHG